MKWRQTLHYTWETETDTALHMGDGYTPIHCVQETETLPYIAYITGLLSVSYTMHVSTCITQISTHKIDNIYNVPVTS